MEDDARVHGIDEREARGGREAAWVDDMLENLTVAEGPSVVRAGRKPEAASAIVRVPSHGQHLLRIPRRAGDQRIAVAVEMVPSHVDVRVTSGFQHRGRDV